MKKALYRKLNFGRLTSHLLCAAVILSVGSPVSTQSRITPPAAAQTRPATQPPTPVVQTLDDRFAEVASRVPAFGGMYFGSERVLHVCLTDTRQEVLTAAQAAIIESFGRERIPSAGLLPVKCQYSFSQLKEMRDRARNLLSIPGVVLIDIDERKNRLTIVVTQMEPHAAEVERQLVKLGIQRDAVNIEQRGPFELLQTVQQTQRPMLGGIQIRSSGTCTLGFFAVRNGVAGFVTNSHCTNTTGGVENTVFHQATISGTTNQVGVELADPLYLPGGNNCPSGRLCRFSDSAFIQRNSGPNPTPAAWADFSKIALPFGYNTGDLTIGTKVRINKENITPLAGELVQKVGAATGGTDGEIIDTCIDSNVFQNQVDTGNTLLCQYRVDGGGSFGDSGSPVFTWSSATLPPGAFPTATLYGILWGGNLANGTFSFSPIGSVQAELGALKTAWNEAGANSPPEVKIVAPLSNSVVGFGGLNIVTFEASVADYEDGTDCCNVQWSSSSPQDGVMGGGKTITYTFGTPGLRSITAKATDSAGLTATSQIIVKVDANNPPQVTIVKPTANQNLYKGFPYVFEGTSFDLNEPFLTLPCQSMVWSSNKAGDPSPIAGCAPTFSFPTTGSRQINLTGTDSNGATGSANVTINVVNAPANSPPVVTILNPQNNNYLDPYATLTILGKATDPDGKNPLTYTWKLKDYSETTLGTGTVNNGQQISMLWKPSNNMSFNCGGRTVKLSLSVKDPDNSTGTAEVQFFVGFPPC